MIAPMKKYSFLVFHRDYEAFLLKLREIGVVHIIEKEGAITEAIRQQMQQVEQTDKLIRSLEARGTQPATPAVVEDASALNDEINEILSAQASLVQRHTQLRKEMAETAPWGDFWPV